MPTHDPDGEDYADGLDALDVYAPESRDDAPELAELPDHPAPDCDIEQQLPDIESDFDSFSPGSATGIELEGSDDFLGGVEPNPAPAEEQMLTLQATNPPATVTVTTYLTGVISRVELDPKVTAMTETELAKEVGAVADVATKRASAIIHDSIVGSLVEHGMRREDARYFVDKNMPFATQEQANDAELALIARHSDQEA